MNVYICKATGYDYLLVQNHTRIIENIMVSVVKELWSIIDKTIVHCLFVGCQKQCQSADRAAFRFLNNRDNTKEENGAFRLWAIGPHLWTK